MRPLLAGDVDSAHRAVLAQPEQEWRAFLKHLITAADEAEAYRKRNDAPHPEYGTGSLMAVALGHKQDASSMVYTERTCRAMIAVLEVLIEMQKTRDP